MTTENKSRVLLTCLLAPFFIFAIYWLFGPYLIWGILVTVVGLALLFLIWKPVIMKPKS